MAGTGARDVQLVISAKNEATAAIDSVAAALKTLADVQGQTGESAETAGGLLGELTSQLEKLNNEAKGLAALSTVAGAIDKAGGAVERMQGQIVGALEQNNALSASYAEAAEATRVLAEAAEQAKAALAGQREALAAMRAAGGADAAAINQQKLAINEASQAWKNLQLQTRAAQANESQLSAALTRSTAAIAKQEAALVNANTNLADIRGLGAGAASALGGVALSQDAIAAASAKAAAEIGRVNAALANQASVGTGAGSTSSAPAASAVAAYRAQVQALGEARAAMDQARLAATELGAQVARAEAPSEQLTRDFILAKAASQQAEGAYLAQATALNRVRGATTGSFAQFSENAAVLERLSVSARESAGAFGQLAAKFPALIAPEAQASAESNTLGETLRRLISTFLQFPAATDAATGGLQRFGSAGNSRINLLARMRNEVLALTTAYVGFYGAINAIGDVLKTYQTLQNAQQRLSVAFGGSQEAAASEMSYVHDEALRLGFDMTTLAEGYSRVAIAAQGMGYSTDSTRKIFNGFAEAARVAGFSAQQTTSAIRGLFEMIDRGTVNARNFNYQIGQQMPFAIQAMAEATGHSVEKFEQLQKSVGGVAASQATLVKFIDILSAHFEGELPEATQTVTADLGRFQTRLRDIQEDIANGGFLNGLTSSLKFLDDEFKSGAADSFFGHVGAALGALAGAIPLVVQNFDLLVDALKIFVALKVTETIRGIVASQSLFGVTFAQGAARVSQMTGALAGLGGETGTVAVAMARLRVTIATVAQSLETMTVQTAILTAREAAASVGTAALGVTLAGLRGVMIGVAVIAEAMWTAIGGIPGLLIAGLTFIVSTLLGNWIGGLGQVNDALTEQDAILGKLRQDYQDANGEAGKLRDTVKDLSAVQIEANKEKLNEQLDKTRSSNDGALVNLTLDNRDSPAIKQLAAAVAAFKKASISAAEYKREIDAVGAADPHLDRKLLGEFADTADKASDLELRLKKADAALREISGTASNADNILLGLAHAGQTVSAAFDSSGLDRFNQALLDLQKQTPSLAKAAELQTKLNKAKDDRDSGILAQQGNLASANPQVRAEAKADIDKITAAYNSAVAEITTTAALDTAQAGSNQGLVTTARQFKGDSRGHNVGQLKDLFNKTGTAFDEKWCADFLNAILKLNDKPGTGSGAAKSFLSYGTKVSNQDAQPGDIMVIKNKDGSYHVGLYAGPAAGGRVDIIGGNQHGGQVNEESFAASSVAAIRRPPSPADQEKSAEKSDTKQQDFDAFVSAKIAEMENETAALKQSPRDAFIAQKLAEIDRKVAESGPSPEDPTAKKLTITPQQRGAVANEAGAEFDAKQQLSEVQKVAAAQNELQTMLKGDAATLTKEEYVRNAAIKDGVNLLDEQGKKYADIKGPIYDLTQQHTAYNKVIGGGQQYVELGKQLSEAYKSGATQGPGGVGDIQQQMAQLKAQLEAALPAAKAFAEAMKDPQMAASLGKVALALQTVHATLYSVQQVNQDLASGFTQAFGKSIEAFDSLTAKGTQFKDVLGQVANAWRTFVGDFLLKIAEMIIQQQILNLLSKTPIGSFISNTVDKAAGIAAASGQITTAAAEAGANAFAATAAIPIVGPAAAPIAGEAASALVISTYLPMIAAGIAHEGAVVGAPGGASRSVSPAAFIGAARMHSGGLVGLASDEMAMILQRNEEVLTTDNPRHIFNQVAAGGSSPQGMGVKIVNAFSAGDMLSQALQSEVGRQVIVNHVRKNQGAFNAALGPRK